MERTDLLRGSLVAAATALAVVLAVVIGAVVVPADRALEPDDELSIPEYDPGSVVAEPLDASGEITPQVAPENQSGVVLIDAAHGNTYERKNIAPLVRALGEMNHTVRFHQSGDNLTAQLRAAKAYVVITPSTEYSASEADAVTSFTDRGGRLLLVGEPDRLRVVQVGFGARLVEVTTAMTTLGSSYGISFDTRYLYNLGTNDGNYKSVVVRPGENASLDSDARVTMYTATSVTARGGTPLLVTPDGTRFSGGTAAEQRSVAIRRGNVTALGDRSFLRSDRYSIADNEVFLATIVEFLAAGESVPDAEFPEESSSGRFGRISASPAS